MCLSLVTNSNLLADRSSWNDNWTHNLASRNGKIGETPKSFLDKELYYGVVARRPLWLVFCGVTLG